MAMTPQENDFAQRLANLEHKLDALLTGLRQVAIMELGLFEDFLGRKRTIVPRKKRNCASEVEQR